MSCGGLARGVVSARLMTKGTNKGAIMKRYAVLAAMVGAVVFLSQPAKAYDYFIQLGVGASFIDDVKTETFTYDDGIDTFTGQGTIDFDASLALSAEFGVQGPISNNLRFGLSWDYINARFDSAGVEGTLNGEPIDVDLVDRDTVEEFGFDADNDTHVVLYNMYWEPMGYNQGGPNQGKILPFIGGGAGVAFIEGGDESLALSASAGARYFVTEDITVGLRYRLIWIDDFDDSFDVVKFQDFFTHTVSATLGFHF